MSLSHIRLLQLLGLLVALLGLGGFWLTRDVERSELTEGQRQVLGLDPEEDTFQASFIVAGKDIWYEQGKSVPITNARGQIVGWDYRGTKFVDGTNTDTILYVNIKDNLVTMIAIPRDLYLEDWETRVNAMYYYQGAEGLKRSVEDVLDLPIDYYAIINIDIFRNLVDALGGVDLTIPYRMYYVDKAAGLTIDFEEGPTHLDGEDASKFIRYRQLRRGDIDRLDNVKLLAYAMLKRVQDLNVRAVFRADELLDTFFEDVETNASPALIRKLVPRIGQLEIQAATLPVFEKEGSSALYHRPLEVEAFLAETFGGTARDISQAPEATLLITNRSGQEGLADFYRSRLIALGVAKETILLRAGPADPAPTRLLATSPYWQQADYYTGLFHTGKQQVDSLAPIEGQEIDLELVLGEDAAKKDALPSGVAARNGDER